MLTDNNPKLPVRDKDVTREFYINKLGFKEFDPKENYEQVYIRTDNIDSFYQSILYHKTTIQPKGDWKPNLGDKRNFLCSTQIIIYCHLNRAFRIKIQLKPYNNNAVVIT
jgi:hypothetical protein